MAQADAPILAAIRAELTRALAWAARAPGAPATWIRARREAETMLTVHWRAGDLVGRSTQEAFYVRCDRTTMSQNDIDAGVFVMQVGVAPVRPAEFVVFRIELAQHRRPTSRRS